MSRVFLVRHGKAAAGWDADRDPGLDETGHEQATALAAEMARLGPMALLTSPLRRARETAAPLARLWGVEPLVEPRLAEVPSAVEDLALRGAWLKEFARGDWSRAGAVQQAWRQGVIEALLGFAADTVIFSHFIPLNVVVGAASGTAEVLVFQPDYCSVTQFDNGGGRLRLVQRGREAASRVL